MARQVERLAGLSIVGPGSAGGLSFTLPALLHAGESRPPGRPWIDSAGAVTPGSRSLRLGDEARELNLTFPVPSDEIGGGGGAAEEAAPGVWVLHLPLAESRWAPVVAATPELVVLSNARSLYREGEPFALAIGELRRRLGASPLLWAPRVALPNRLALLGYLGIDLLDTTEGLWRASEGEFLDATLGALSPAARELRHCRCGACSRNPPGSLAEHAAAIFDDEWSLVRASIEDGHLREMVEARLTSEPGLSEHLRYADRHLGAMLEERTPVVAREEGSYVLREDRRRPEVVRFRERFLARYRPPGSKRILLLVPCSKTKPYRNSPTHRKFRRAMETLLHPARVHVVSVTSPLGLVPRELEDVYPARHYDIPVTGEWDEEERQAVIRALQHMIATGSYTDLVMHLDPDEYAFLAPALRADLSPRWVLADGRTTSAEAIDQLRSALVEIDSRGPAMEGGPLGVVRDELAAVAGVQFGPDAAGRLFAPPVRLAGRPWFQRVTDGGGVDLATWKEDRGLFQLTVAGAERLAPEYPLPVVVNPGVPITGDLFAPGVARADPQIRVGDAVSLVRDGELLGVGEAHLPGPLMEQLAHGRAVHIRHRARPSRSKSLD